MSLDPTGFRACHAQSPKHANVAVRVRCNRPENHEGPHRKYRASDFLILAEWTEFTGYRIFPRKEAPLRAPNP